MRVIGTPLARFSLKPLKNSPMATATKLVKLRPVSKPISSPFSARFFSSSSEPKPEGETPAISSSPAGEPQSSSESLVSSLSGIKERLRLHSPQQTPRLQTVRQSFNRPSSNLNPAPPDVSSFEDIRKNLAEFRRRSFPTSGDNSSSAPSFSSQPVSFHELYKRNVLPGGGDSNADPSNGATMRFPMDGIRKSLSMPGGKVNDSMSLARIRERLGLKPQDPNEQDSNSVIGDSNKVPVSVFAKEMREKRKAADAGKSELLRSYSHEELGEKLKTLRPQNKQSAKVGFSLKELNERLIKLGELEKKQSPEMVSGVTFIDIKNTLQLINQKKMNNSAPKVINIIGQLGGTPKYMLEPPNEHLVEQYFHPDNMSSAEKLKLELKKVRDEFKLSESDCGSARVQVAQLTTKIKHLSTALHKKDKHSRKGLHAMVQRRKKLLKYIRRTDWDSYCFVLSKLGLRDNPDYKF